ncbi:hypothetical protein [Streptomyces barkulensis]|nr:hypothetical protein [Streptomyces barkulensis]
MVKTCLLVNGRQIVVGVHGPSTGTHVREAAAGSTQGRRTAGAA